jgi:prepilin-type N-terminal cleavage/methylation domain-containing protein
MNVVRRRSDPGMTLVEIMITMLISSIVAASTFTFFAGQQRIYETQTKVLNIQQNLWAAMEVVARYTRAAGSGMFECVRPASYYNATLDNGSRRHSTSPSDGPLTNSLATRPQAGVRAYDASAGAMQWIPPLWLVNNSTSDAGVGVVSGTDVITIAFGNRTSGTDVDATLSLDFASTASTSSISLTGTGTGSMFRRGGFILLLSTPDWGSGGQPDPDRGCTMFQITTDPTGGTTLAHASSAINAGDIIWNPSGGVAGMLPNGGGYTANHAGVRNFGQLTWVAFFVKLGANGIPNLMMWQRHLGGASGSPQILAEGIEDLQVSFACDTGALGVYDLTALNGQIDEGSDDNGRRQDEWWNNVPGDTLPSKDTDGFCNMPTAVRLTLVVRTLAPDDLIDTTVTANGPLDVEDHRYTSPRPTDKYRRRVLSTTVYPRNNKAP